MKWLITPVLWTLALIVALAVLWRIYRGKPIILRGRWTPRVIRMTAVLMVLFGLGADKADAAPVPVESKKGKVNEELPPTITNEVLQQWIELHQATSAWTRFKQLVTPQLQKGEKLGEGISSELEALALNLPEKLRGLLTADLRSLKEGKAIPIATSRELIVVLNEAEAKGFIDPWLAAHLWRKTEHMTDNAERKPLIDLMTRLHRHARLANAMIACRFTVRPIMEPPIAWRGKGGRPPNWQQNQQAAMLLKQMQAAKAIQTDFLVNLKTAYARADGGTWQKDALILLQIEKGSCPVTLIRSGEAGMPLSEGGIRFGRLDLLETTPGDRPAHFLHPVLGRIEIPAGKLVTVWDLPKYLSDKSRESIKKTVKEALGGNEKAAQQIEMMLPLAQGFVREGLKTSSTSEGAPRLRLILTQFDDVPMAPALSTHPLLQDGSGLIPGNGGFDGGGRFGPR